MLKRLLRQLVICVIEWVEEKSLQRLINEKENEQFRAFFVDGTEKIYTYTFITLTVRRFLEELNG